MQPGADLEQVAAPHRWRTGQAIPQQLWKARALHERGRDAAHPSGQREPRIGCLVWHDDYERVKTNASRSRHRACSPPERMHGVLPRGEHGALKFALAHAHRASPVLRKQREKPGRTEYDVVDLLLRTTRCRDVVPHGICDPELRQRASGRLLGEGIGQDVSDVARRRPHESGVVRVLDRRSPACPFADENEIPLASPAARMAVGARRRPGVPPWPRGLRLKSLRLKSLVRFRPGTTAVVGCSRRCGSDLLPGELHRREFDGSAAGIRMRLPQPPAIGAFELVFRRGRWNTEHLVWRRRDRAVGHPLALVLRATP
jgi:hypothetical protein